MMIAEGLDAHQRGAGLQRALRQGPSPHLQSGQVPGFWSFYFPDPVWRFDTMGIDWHYLNSEPTTPRPCRPDSVIRRAAPLTDGPDDGRENLVKCVLDRGESGGSTSLLNPGECRSGVDRHPWVSTIRRKPRTGPPRRINSQIRAGPLRHGRRKAHLALLSTFPAGVKPHRADGGDGRDQPDRPGLERRPPTRS